MINLKIKKISQSDLFNFRRYKKINVGDRHARPLPASGGPRYLDEVDAGSGTGSAEKSLPLRTERALRTELYPFL